MIARIALAALYLSLAGCIVPFPRTTTVLPRIHGTVVDAQNSAPLPLAGVIVKGRKESSVITSSDGTFSTDPLTHTQNVWFWNPFAAPKRRTLLLQIVHPNHQKLEHPVSFSYPVDEEVHLSEPIRLMPKLGAL